MLYEKRMLARLCGCAADGAGPSCAALRQRQDPDYGQKAGGTAGDAETVDAIWSDEDEAAAGQQWSESHR